MAKRVFTFGSNEGGIHGGGAAKHAYEKKGARFGFSYGHVGNSFAIPTKNDRLETLPLNNIQAYVYGFIAYAIGHPKLTFQVTQIGCGRAGIPAKDMAEMFIGAPKNCLFDEAWKPYLGDSVSYWGTFNE